jgi:hypothetical protein
MYRQPGKVASHENAPGDERQPVTYYSVQALTLSLMPATTQARDLLLDWLTADCMKTDAETLNAAWTPWAQMSNDPALFNAAFSDAALVRRDLAEAWILHVNAPDRTGWQPKDPEQLDKFMKNIWRQVFNPDDRVRQACVRYVLTRDAQDVRKATVFLKSEKRSPLRHKTIADAKSAHDAQMELYHLQGTPQGARYTEQLEEFIEAVK